MVAGIIGGLWGRWGRLGFRFGLWEWVGEAVGGAFAGFGFLGFALFAGLEPGQPDTDFIENDHRQSHQAQREDVRRGGQDRRCDKDRHNGIRAGAGHRLIGQQAQFDEHHHHHRQLKRESEQQRELGGKGDVLADPPVVGNPELAAPFVEELERPRQYAVVGKQHPAQKQPETDGQRRPEHLFLVGMQARHDELQDVHQQQRKRQHDPREKRQLHRQHEGLGGSQGGHQPQVAATVDLRAWGGFQQRADLAFEVIGGVKRLDKLLTLGLWQGLGGPQQGDGFSVETHVVIPEGGEKCIALGACQAEHGMFHGFGALPLGHVEWQDGSVFHAGEFGH